MFKNYNNYLITFIWDKKARQSIDLFYGNDTDAKKVELSKPIREMNKKEIDLYNWYENNLNITNY